MNSCGFADYVQKSHIVNIAEISHPIDMVWGVHYTLILLCMHLTLMCFFHASAPQNSISEELYTGTPPCPLFWYVVYISPKSEVDV